MTAMFEDGEIVKHILAYAKISIDGYGPAEMVWRPAIVVKTVDFGHIILSDGKIQGVHAIDLEKIDNENE